MVWGPATWHYLHSMSFTYPNYPTEYERHVYLTFIQSLCNVLPCRSCREGLVNNLARVPLLPSDLRGRVSFAHWMYRLHNEVNQMLSKDTTISFLQVCNRHIKSRIGRLCIINLKSQPNIAGDGDKPEDEDDAPKCCAQMAYEIIEHEDTRHRKWNDAFWLFVHCVSFNYPTEPTIVNRVQYQQFFTYLVRTIPPASKWSQRLHTIVLDPSSKLAIDPSRFENRHVFSEWVYAVHRSHIGHFRNMQPHPTLGEFRDSYEKYRASNCTLVTKKEHGGCVQSAQGVPQRCVVKLQ